MINKTKLTGIKDGISVIIIKIN